MKFLATLEKKKLLWWVIVLCLVFFLFRLPSIIEPYWYGDENIYEVVGQAMDHGRLLYRDIWDNKPPLLYIIYAIAQGDQATVKTFSLISGLFSLIVFVLLSEKLFKKYLITIPLSILYLFLLGTPILEGNIANAEVFMLLPILLAGLLLYKLTDASWIKSRKLKHSSIVNPQSLLFTAGLLLGLAFLFKIVALFDFAAFLIFFNLLHLPENISFSFRKQIRKHEVGFLNKTVWENSILNSRFLILGFVVPLFITFLYFAFNNALTEFFQATFSGNVSYVGSNNYFFGIPQGLLLIKVILLVAVIYMILLKRKAFSKQTLFIILWLSFSLFNVFFSERPYTHYVIVLLPSFCLFVGLFFSEKLMKEKLLVLTGIALILFIIFSQFQLNFNKSFLYYQNAITFLTNGESVEKYQEFFDSKTPRDYAVASFVIKNTTPADNIFVWGNNPEIYALSHKLPPGKYTVAYHITQNNALTETEIAIAKAKPKYVIILTEAEPLPFGLPLYIMRYTIPGATIYERSF
jgi:hypothetical protein